MMRTRIFGSILGLMSLVACGGGSGGGVTGPSAPTYPTVTGTYGGSSALVLSATGYQTEYYTCNESWNVANQSGATLSGTRTVNCYGGVEAAQFNMTIDIAGNVTAFSDTSKPLGCPVVSSTNALRFSGALLEGQTTAVVNCSGVMITASYAVRVSK